MPQGSKFFGLLIGDFFFAVRVMVATWMMNGCKAEEQERFDTVLARSLEVRSAAMNAFHRSDDVI